MISSLPWQEGRPWPRMIFCQSSAIIKCSTRLLLVSHVFSAGLNTNRTDMECGVQCTLPAEWTAQLQSGTPNLVWAKFGVGHDFCRCRLWVQLDPMMQWQEQESRCKGRASLPVMPSRIATCFSSLIGPTYPGLPGSCVCSCRRILRSSVGVVIAVCINPEKVPAEQLGMLSMCEGLANRRHTSFKHNGLVNAQQDVVR